MRIVVADGLAVQLVLDAVFWAKGGEVFVTKMPMIRIEDLAVAMVEELAQVYEHTADSVPIEVVGHRPGEKLYEELVNEEEVRRTIELAQHFVVLPALGQIYQETVHEYEGQVYQATVHEYEGQVAGQLTTAYNSSVEPAMTQAELRVYLWENGQLDPERVGV